jgi:hypothetical protein
VEYRWRQWDVDERAAPEEGGLELGELEDSDRVTALVEQGFDSDLRHFRISFDEHDRYDVTCRHIRIEYEPRRSTTRAVARATNARLAITPQCAPARSMTAFCSSRSTPWKLGWYWSAWRAGGFTKPRMTSNAFVPRSRTALPQQTGPPGRDHPRWLGSVPPD